jgi:phosphoglycerate dehydrogenase-like enzyme
MADDEPPVPESPRHRIAILDDYLGVALDLAPWSSLEGCEVTVFREPIGDTERLAEVLAPFDVVCAMRERTPLPAAVLDRLPALRLLVTTGMQNASIDVAAATSRGVVVCGTPSRASATAEMTWTLILGAARHVADHDRGMRAGAWQRHLGLGLADRRLGVIGLGRNGSRVAEIGLAFGMDVVAWSQNLTDDRAAEVGVRRVDRNELLATSDVVTIHLRLSDRTTGLIDAAALARMRPTAILVNTSRGPIVDEAALLAALDAGRPAMAALDVYDEEPLPADHPLRRRADVLITPHTGYVTDDNMRGFYEATVEDVAAWLDGRPIRVLGEG